MNILYSPLPVCRPRVMRAAMAVVLSIGAGQTLTGATNAAGPVKVEIRKENGRFRLYRGGQPYFIKGAVFWAEPDGKFPIADIAARGGNSVRTHDPGTIHAAHKLGMTALVNLRMKMEYAHKFDYSDAKAVREQFDSIRQRVLELKDHPAVLMWAIGNELSVRYTNKNVWKAVNDVARFIHEVDPNHPAMTVIGAGFLTRGGYEIKDILERCPDLDLIGINAYGNLEEVPAKLRQEGWQKPYVVTEWGPTGHWQMPKTEWNAEIEETSTEKAGRYLERYRNVMLKDTGRCFGSYAFIWRSRLECTHTWYGMFLETGERTEAVNAMQYLWTGQWPANRAPRVEPLTIDGRGARDNIYLKPGSEHTAAVQVADPDGDPVALRWEIVAEVAKGGYAGMGEKRSTPMPELIRTTGGGRMVFAAPPQQGPYRVFVFAADGHGNGATANIPFFVKP